MSYNKEKHAEYSLLRYHERRNKYFKDKKCVSCGTKSNLHLDHIDPKTKISHRIWSWSTVRMNEELSKCQILCGKCHANKTRKDNNSQTKHGQRSMYKYHGCRCELCRAGNAAAVRRQRANKCANGEVVTHLPAK